MAVPRNRQSNSRKNLRRAHDAKKPIALLKCDNCGTARQPHRICLSCGQYGKKEILYKTESKRLRVKRA